MKTFKEICNLSFRDYLKEIEIMTKKDMDKLIDIALNDENDDIKKSKNNDGSIINENKNI